LDSTERVLVSLSKPFIKGYDENTHQLTSSCQLLYKGEILSLSMRTFKSHPSWGRHHTYFNILTKVMRRFRGGVAANCHLFQRAGFKTRLIHNLIWFCFRRV
jgi:hypothetical protein